MKVRWAGNVARKGEERYSCRVSVWKRKGKRLLRRSGCRWEYNIKLGLKEIGC